MQGTDALAAGGRAALKGEQGRARRRARAPVEEALSVLVPLLAEHNELLPVVTRARLEDADEPVVDLDVLLARQLRLPTWARQLRPGKGRVSAPRVPQPCNSRNTAWPAIVSCGGETVWPVKPARAAPHRSSAPVPKMWPLARRRARQRQGLAGQLQARSSVQPPLLSSRMLRWRGL
jgi:hypothetical protein